MRGKSQGNGSHLGAAGVPDEQRRASGTEAETRPQMMAPTLSERERHGWVANRGVA